MLRAIKIVFHFFVLFNFSCFIFFGQLSSCNFLAARCSLIAIVTMCRGRVRVACLAHKVTWRKFALCALKYVFAMCVCGCFVFAPVCVTPLTTWVQKFTFSLPLCLPWPTMCRVKNYFTASVQNNPQNLNCGPIASNNLNTLYSSVIYRGAHHTSFACHFPQLSMKAICASFDSNCSCSWQHCRQIQSLQQFPISCTSCRICLLILAVMVHLLVKLLIHIKYHLWCIGSSKMKLFVHVEPVWITISFDWQVSQQKYLHYMSPTLFPLNILKVQLIRYLVQVINPF